MRAFADHHLGKGVVVAKDTPNFIGNHIALYGVVRTLEAVASGRYTIEEVDAITGPALGRPGSATFRTMDIAGIDVLAHVMRNLNERLTDEDDRNAFAAPALLQQMLDRGALGEKSGAAFTSVTKARSAKARSWTLDLDDPRISPASSRHASRRLKPANRSTTCASACACFQRQGQGGRVPARDAGPHARLYRAGGTRISRIRSTMWIG